MRGRKYAYRFLIVSILIGILISVPNYFQRGRTQLIYMDSNGHKTATPLNIYAVNGGLVATYAPASAHFSFAVEHGGLYVVKVAAGGNTKVFKVVK